MDNFNDKKTFSSEFNEAGYQISRLNNLWTLCNTYSRKGQLDEWKWLLDRIWVELSADAKKKNENKYFTLNNLHNKKISLSKNTQQLYQALQEKEIFLKCLQEDVGKGGKKREQYDSEW